MSELNFLIYLGTIFKTLRKDPKQTHCFCDFGDTCVKKGSWHNCSKSHTKKVETCLIDFSFFSSLYCDKGQLVYRKTFYYSFFDS